ncbi:hypothetical protein BX600DRAFT_443845 [Xylariales sp. PMI_506]|nr:hypothetical protein BX600DRAFT_443845 [Xylariales sp. PMI_506]
MFDIAAAEPAGFHCSPQGSTTTHSGATFPTTPSGHQPLDEVSPSIVWRPDEFSLIHDYQEYQEELRCLIFSTAQSMAPSRQGSPAAGESWADGGSQLVQRVQDGSNHHLVKEILSNRENIKYLRNYVDQVAPWLDMFDSDRAFGMQLPSLARKSPPLLYAILALSARQMERKEGTKTFRSLELYQEVIQLLPPLLQSRDFQVIPICTILCCLEMMSASAQDWRRHLEGCAALFSSFGVHGFSGGLLQAVFWCYARMDLCGALISDGTEITNLPPSKWLAPGSHPDDARHLFRSSPHPDMHANYAVYLCSRVCELQAQRTRFVELGEDNGCTGSAFDDGWVALWEELQGWLADRPSSFHPVKTLNKNPFPESLFTRWSAISSHQLYHTACILMLGMIPHSIKVAMTPGSASSTLWHAKQICGISIANPHHGCLNNAIQPLWVAGRLLSHKSEHSILVKLIWNIESLTGWGTCWRIKDLEAAWGYKIRINDIGS